ncbi:Fpg/Nei family DNA glycosylase, partial [Actinotalea ferrariae]|uniref:zinc finger domain-containing protein n=1 Tax=Actinotalea ferrariae TaxID=1386098 RepID=UPI001EC95008
VRMGEGERALPAAGSRGRDVVEEPEEHALDEPDLPFPPAPVGQVRVRLAGADTVADLRGAITCEVLTPDDVVGIVAKAGPDPRVDAWPDPRAVVVQRVRRRKVAVGQLLMDQAVVSGIGNIYRAELLFRAQLEPHTPGASVPEEVVAGLWDDWVGLLDDGVRVGAMLTREDLDEPGRAAALADPALRHAVYGRAGEPCLRCGATVLREEMAGRTLYWCPGCQV